MKVKIKSLYQKAFQYLCREYDSILLLIGLTMLFYLCMNLVRAQFLYNNSNVPQYRYSKEYTMDGDWTGELLDEMSEWFEGKGDNCSIRCIGGKVGNSLEMGELVVCLSAEALVKKEKLDLEKWNQKKNGILIDGELRKFTYGNAGETYILINDMEFVVYDVIREMELLGQSSYANWVNLDEEHRRAVLMALQDGDRKGAESNQTIQIERLTQFAGEPEAFEERYGEYCHVRLNYQGVYDSTRKYLALKMEFFYLGMVVMGICSLDFIVNLWVSRRKRELLIKRIWGFGYWRLVGTLMRECFAITLMAFGTAVILELVKIGFSVASSLLWHRVIRVLLCSALIAIAIEIWMVAIQTLSIIRMYPTQENIETAGE